MAALLLLVSLFGLVGVFYITPLHRKWRYTSKRWFNALLCVVAFLLAGHFAPKEASQPVKPVQATISHTSSKEYTKLSIDSVTTQGNKVIVKGSTDLPDGAEVYVDFDIPQKDTDLYLGSSVRVPVKSGHFEATITPRPFKELQHGPYEITVEFFANPNNQSATVLKLVGQKGERIKGPLAKKDSMGYMEMVVTKTVNLNLAIQLPAPAQGDNFSGEHPVTASYLKQVLSFMDTFYHQLKEKEDTASNDESWSAFLASNNQKGWAYYRKITYQTGNNESPYTLTARDDVGQAWIFLNSLAMDINDKVGGKSNGNESEDERQYQEYYNKATKEVEKLPQ